MYDLPLTTLSRTLVDRPPATQFAARLRASNAFGWGEWSPTAWLTTLPTSPAAPVAPTCGGVGGGRSSDTSLYVQIEETNATHGQPITRYQVRVERPADAADAADNADVPTLLYERTTGPSLADRGFHLTSELVRQHTGVATYTIKPSTPFVVTSRAYNMLGWSDWSAPSTT